ncbi:MAG TPA: FAD-dependent oxidoreductase [Anaerolineales bacterium]|nr:FAD-dependent oxidoreductase [Anaerolineales bacterium]
MPQKLHCKVVDLIPHGEHVYSLSLKPDSLAPRFFAGQFLHLALDPYQPGDFWPESRPFSIASSPGDRSLLTITYAVKGRFTTRMEAGLRLGGEVWIKMPYGEFAINTDDDSCLLAGGTGVTAFTAFLDGLTAEYQRSVHVFYGARRPKLLIYRPMIEAAAKRCANLKTCFLVEEGEIPNGMHGRINVDIVWQSLPAPLSIAYYLSGPPVMLKTLSEALIDRGVSLDQIAIDAWE